MCSDQEGDMVECVESPDTWLPRDELRQEAIKQIKNHIGTIDCVKINLCVRCEWIKHFFNITEEDLK